MSLQGCILRDGRRKCLRIAVNLIDPDGEIPTIILEVNDIALSQEVELVFLVELLIMCWRQSDQQCDIDRVDGRLNMLEF